MWALHFLVLAYFLSLCWKYRLAAYSWWAEHIQVGIPGTALTVERCKGQRCSAPVKNDKVQMVITGVTVKHWQQVGHVLYKDQADVCACHTC